MSTVAEALAYAFDADHANRTTEELTELLGGKGAGLAAMTAMGLPVPPGFTFTTAACRRYLAEGWHDDFDAAVRVGLAGLEAATGKCLGDPADPLLVSVRSGARDSMPGMMDTVLDVGMTDAVAAGLGARTGDLGFATDTHRRSLLSYAEVVRGAGDEVLGRAREAGDVAAMRAVLADGGVGVPTDPVEQVVAAVRAVFDSWTSARAVRYREVEHIPADLGTAATVQAMVFGNLGDDSGTGVAFTRDPSTGEPGLMGDFLVGAQGEDVVAGTHATQHLAAMRERWPEAWHELVRIADVLEHHYADMVDIEFTVERGTLWMLQARRGKRSHLAAVRTAVHMAEDETFPVDRATAVARCRHLLDHPPTIGVAPADDDAVVVATGLAAAPGRASGRLCLDVDEAVRLEADGVDVVLVRRETSPADVHGIAASVGLVTTLGGLVSHAAVVARSWGLPAVVGAELTIESGSVVGAGGRVEAGETVTVDGDAGRLLLGDHQSEGTVPDEVRTLLAWAAELDVAASTAPAGHDAAAPTDVAGPGDVDEFLVLHALRIKGMAPTATVAAMLGAAEGAVRDQAGALAATGLAKFHEGRDMWQITPDGRERHDALMADTVSGLDLDALRYDEFLRLNDDFKALCTDWQLRDGAPNDHADTDYDRSVLHRLLALDEAAQPVVASFAEVLTWTAPYPARLRAACERAQTGDPKAVTGVLCDSYHDIWMELHEDLILTQGIDRAAEGSS